MENKIVISTDFLKSFMELPKTIQKEIINFLPKFIENPELPGFKFKPIKIVNGKQLKSVRINENYRGIIYEEKETNILHLLWIEPHDDSYNAADSIKKIKTGNISFLSNEYYEKFGLIKNKSKNLFSSISDKELLDTGLEKLLLPMIRNIRTRNEFLSMKGEIPEDVYFQLECIEGGIHANYIKSYYNLQKNELINYFYETIIKPGLEHKELDIKVKNSMEYTFNTIKNKRTIAGILEFYYDALKSKSGQYIKEKLYEKRLKAFEDEDVRKRVQEFREKIY